MENKKIVVCGEFVWPWYQEAAASALENLGYKVDRFGWFDYLYNRDVNDEEPRFISLYHRIVFKIKCGPIVNKINRDFVNFIVEKKPNVLILYHAVLIKASTVKYLKKTYPSIKIVLYTPDNPFSQNNFLYWRHFLKGIKYADYTTPHRESNVKQIISYGGVLNNNFIMLPYFIPNNEYPIDYDLVPDVFKCDVVFAGHFENDMRINCLELLLKLGLKVKLFGGGWDKASDYIDKNSPLHTLLPVKPAIGIDYLYALSGAKICLCFFSKLNNDSYTTRVFQIPATRSFMLSEYSKDLRKIYRKGVDYDDFSDLEEFENKICFYLSNDEELNNIANSAYKKVYDDNHDIESRMIEWMKSINEH